MTGAAAYFAGLAAALDRAGLFLPALVLDLDRLDANISAARAALAPDLTLRVVDKSLPSVPLMAHIMAGMGTRRIMTFHPPVARAMLAAFPAADFLLGKPLPVAQAAQMLADLPPEQAARICWLIDTPERLAQYAGLGRTLRFAVEADIGLHRGGVATPAALARLLGSAPQNMTCDGLMGYEAHIHHIPALLGGPARARARALDRYRALVAVLGPDQRRILNLGGSSTALGYGAGTGANEVAMGSGFVKPADFDGTDLAPLSPAVFIAAPVLKSGPVALPGLDRGSALARALRLIPARGVHIHGGKWMADPVWPPGLAGNATLGRSSNQQFYSLPRGMRLGPDDRIFLRPTQSEAVLQQFGPLKVFAGGEIIAEWPVLPPG